MLLLYSACPQSRKLGLRLYGQASFYSITWIPAIHNYFTTTRTRTNMRLKSLDLFVVNFFTFVRVVNVKLLAENRPSRAEEKTI
jgi:hypothetical protein